MTPAGSLQSKTGGAELQSLSVPLQTQGPWLRSPEGRAHQVRAGGVRAKRCTDPLAEPASDPHPCWGEELPVGQSGSGPTSRTHFTRQT